jgi:hypothetical protein
MGSAAGQKLWLSIGLISTIASPLIGTLGLLGAASAIALTASPSQAAPGSWNYNPDTNQLQVTVPEGVQPRYFLVAEPNRIVLDLPSTQVGAAPAEGNYNGTVQQIRVAQFQPDLARIVMQLAPDTVLAPEQVQLEKVGDVEQGNQRWMLRPLVATVPAVAPPVAQPVVSESVVSQVPVALPPAIPTTSPTAATVSVPDALPEPIQPNVRSTPDQPIAIPPAPPQPDRATRREARRAERQAQRAERSEQLAQALPPATFTPATSGSVSVPSLPRQSVPAAAPTAPAPAAAPVTVAANGDVVPFGQPLPGNEAAPLQPEDLQDRNDRDDRREVPNLPPIESSPNNAPLTEISVNSTFDVLIPAGTRLSLYYPQEVELELTEEPVEEVLFLAQTVRDREGNIIAPIDSQVIGSFESGSEGSRFIARSLRIEGENVRITAASESIGGRRQVSSRNIFRTSAAGALAGLLLSVTTGIGTLAGVALGALSGAGSAVLGSPQPAVIQPNDVIEVQVLEDLPR